MNFTYEIDRKSRLVDVYVGTAENHSALDFTQAKEMCIDILTEIKKLEEQE